MTVDWMEESDPERVMGELLHSVSQPLTILQCALETGNGESTDWLPQAIKASGQTGEYIRLICELWWAGRRTEALEDVSLTQVVRSVARELAERRPREATIVLNGSAPGQVRCAPNRLHRALWLVMSVCLDLTAPGASLHARLSAGDDGEAVFRVESRIVEAGSQELRAVRLRQAAQLGTARKLLEDAPLSIRQQERFCLEVRLPLALDTSRLAEPKSGSICLV